MISSSTRTAGVADVRHSVVDPDAVRAEIRVKYAEVATNPTGTFHFHTGRPLATRLGYAASALTSLPDSAIASFAGSRQPLQRRVYPSPSLLVVAPTIRRRRGPCRLRACAHTRSPIDEEVREARSLPRSITDPSASH